MKRKKKRFAYTASQTAVHVTNMSKRLLSLKVKQFVPIFIGLWLGIAFSLMSAPFIHDSCTASPDGNNAVHQKQGSDDSFLTAQFGGPFRKTNSVGAASEPISNFDYGRSEEYEPKLKKPDANVKTTQMPQSAERKRKLLRPRYASTELQVREKLFIGVLSMPETIATLGLAVNRTLAHTVPKLMFFVPRENAHIPPTMPVVLLTEAGSKLGPFQMFDHIGNHYLKTYDWFYFMPDSTYVRGRKLFDMVKRTSINQDVYIGNRTKSKGAKKSYCNFEGGMLLSHNMMTDVINDQKWCRQNANSTNISQNIGLCVLHATGKTCANTIGSHRYSHYSKSKFDFDRDMNKLRHQPEFCHTLTVSGLQEEKTVYKLHRYFCELELDETKRALEDKKSYIVKLSPHVPTEKLTFPIGIDPPVKLKTRFDMIRWDYFTTTHIYIDSDFSNVQELTGVHKKDIDEIMMVAMEKINKKYNTHNTLHQLINGYRRFDPVRGMAYILDLNLKSPSGKKIHKRVHLMRPLSQVEIVPMPYVTESSRVNLILPVTLSERDLVVSFLDSYAKTCLDAGDNTHLFVVFVYNVTTYHSDTDVFSVLKSMIAFYETKYQSGAHIAWTTVYARKPNQYTVMDAIARKFVPESLFLLCTVGMELSTEFLNRVRMNTIAGWQVFFPIAFWQYKPNLIYEEKPYPTMIEINKMVGHFDNTRYEHASFYNSDYQHARHLLASPASKLNTSDDLFDMFLKFHQVHVFRAVEPALKIRYRERTCNPMLNEDAYQRCIVGRAAGLASKSQLAMLIFEQQQNVDQAHGNGPKQQNEPNSEQVKTNVKKKKKKK